MLQPGAVDPHLSEQVGFSNSVFLAALDMLRSDYVLLRLSDRSISPYRTIEHFDTNPKDSG